MFEVNHSFSLAKSLPNQVLHVAHAHINCEAKEIDIQSTYLKALYLTTEARQLQANFNDYSRP